MTYTELIQKLQNNDLDIVEHTEKVLEEAQKINSEYSYFETLAADRARSQAQALQKQIKAQDPKLIDKPLLGIAVSAKDGICVKGVETKASSQILEGYKPLFDATVIQKAEAAGAIIIGKTVQDEFGFGSFSVNLMDQSKVPKNPFDKDRSCGGSSGGAAGITQKANFEHIALGESTGGSIAAPASFCGVFGLTPTYGRVSRYGLLDFGNSLDKIGTMGKTCKEAALLLQAIAGFDENESTALNKPVDNYSDFCGKDIKGMKIGIIKQSFGEGADEAVEKSVRNGIETLRNNGAVVEEISLELPIKYGLAAYYLIGTSEASTNLAKYCGMRYGKHEELSGSFNEYFTKVRSMHFTKEAKRRIMLGTFARMSGYRDAYYMKALKVRTKIVEEYKKVFKSFDAIVCPTMPMLPPKFEEIEKLTPLQHYLADISTVSPNLAGLPHLNIPVEEAQGLPVGMLLIGDHLEEKKLVQLGSAFDK